MSRSRKKHCGAPIISCRSDKPWRKQWHSAMRAKERDLFRLQMKFPERDFCYPVPNEVGNLWSAPSDGGSVWMYADFEHYFFERTHPMWFWSRAEILTRKALWKECVIKLVGK